MAGAGSGDENRRVSAGIAVAPDGSVYLADPGFGRLLRVDRAGTPAIVADTAFAGSHLGASPIAVVVTPDGVLLVSDAWQHVIWKITIDEDAGR